jgi:hypothetical protein
MIARLYPELARQDNPELDKAQYVRKTYYIYSLEGFDKKREEIIHLCEYYNARAYIHFTKRNNETISKHMVQDIVRDYFNGVRDHYQYEHLEKNFGIGNPTSIGFTPLTRKHIEAIVGEYLSTKPQPKISCKDQRTLTNIHRDKQLEIAKKQKEWVSKYLENAIYAAIAGE